MSPAPLSRRIAPLLKRIAHLSRSIHPFLRSIHLLLRRNLLFSRSVHLLSKRNLLFSRSIYLLSKKNLLFSRSIHPSLRRTLLLKGMTPFPRATCLLFLNPQLRTQHLFPKIWPPPLRVLRLMKHLWKTQNTIKKDCPPQSLLQLWLRKQPQLLKGKGKRVWRGLLKWSLLSRSHFPRKNKSRKSSQPIQTMKLLRSPRSKNPRAYLEWIPPLLLNKRFPLWHQQTRHPW